jgi:peroxiredoxin
MPAFQQAHIEFLSEDLVILGINATNQDQITAVEEFVANNKITFPILLDQNGSVSSLYNLYSLPTTIFIDKSGIIQKIIIGGPIPTALLRVEILKLIEEY